MQSPNQPDEAQRPVQAFVAAKKKALLLSSQFKSQLGSPGMGGPRPSRGWPIASILVLGLFCSSRRADEEIGFNPGRVLSPASRIRSPCFSLGRGALGEEFTAYEGRTRPAQCVALENVSDGHAVLFRRPVLVSRIAADPGS